MRSLFNSPRGRVGAAAVEMALLSPFFLLLLVAFFDYGSFLADASAVEKGVRAGAMLAARSPQPVTGDPLVRVINVVKTGDVSGTAPLTVAGWADGGATLSVSTRTTTISGELVQVVTVTASVPYRSLLQGLLQAVGLPLPIITSEHEQAYVGA